MSKFYTGPEKPHHISVGTWNSAGQNWSEEVAKRLPMGKMFKHLGIMIQILCLQEFARHTMSIIKKKHRPKKMKFFKGKKLGDLLANPIGYHFFRHTPL